MVWGRRGRWWMMRGEKSLDREGIGIMDGRGSYLVCSQEPLRLEVETDGIGVKELLEAAKPLPSTKKQRGELRKNVDADYFGYRDEEDGLLLEYEEAQEEVAMGRTIKDPGGNQTKGGRQLEMSVGFRSKQKLNSGLSTGENSAYWSGMGGDIFLYTTTLVIKS